MVATQREQNIYGKDIEIVSRDDQCVVFRIKCETGNVTMTSYNVFPGIDLVYDDVHTQRCLMDAKRLKNVIEINHCREGRIECEWDNEFFYLSPGDLSISSKYEVGHESYFPNKHYHGITILIDADKAPDCLSCLLDDVNVEPSVLKQKFCKDNSLFVARSNQSLEHIFSELYSVPIAIRKGYFKVKILELLLFLSGMDIDQEKISKICYSKSQVTLAKNVCKYLVEHMDVHITIEQLTEIFHVSQTQIKNSFKGVYGSSIYSYIRKQKMQSAAIILKESDCTVLEVAGRFGYDNGSKFAKAFKDVMGKTPNQFKKEK